MKFGGTSVATEAGRARVVDQVVARRAQGGPVCLVVSAMGRQGDAYATDTLLGLARNAYRGVTARELDLIASCGEVISAVVMTASLQGAGVPATALTGGQAGIVTDAGFMAARVRRVDTGRLERLLAAGEVAVVAGFQGETEAGDVTTLGRGGSDITAVVVGVALGAETVEIYTDVEGVLTADPRVVPDARQLGFITYEELCQLAHEGARVVHPLAVEVAMRNQLPLRVRSTFSDGPGTLVGAPDSPNRGTAVTSHHRPVTGVASVNGVAHFEVDFEPEHDSRDELRLFRSLADHRISLDMILVTPGRKAFIIDESQVELATAVLRAGGFAPRVRRSCAKVSVVGMGMRGVPGVMAAVSGALHGAGIEILQTADSHLSISCLVAEHHARAAVRALHETFQLGEEA
jgi:aspartate kinase